MSELLVAIITSPDPRGPQPLARRRLPRGRRSPSCSPSAPRWTPSAAPATISTSASARCSSSTPSTASTCPRKPGAARAGGLDPVRRLPAPAATAASRRRSTSSCAPQAAHGPSDAHLQRAGRGLSPPRLPDAGRPGAPQRALGARQPVDVPHRPPRRPAAAHPPGTARARSGRRHLSRSCASARPVRMDLTPQRLERHLLPRHGLSRKAPAC